MTDFLYSSVWILKSPSDGAETILILSPSFFNSIEPSTSVDTSDPLAIRMISGVPSQSLTIYAPFSELSASAYLSPLTEGRSFIFCLDRMSAVGVFLFSSAIFQATVVSTASAGLRTSILFSP